MRKKLALISCVVAVGLPLAACGDGSTATQDTSSGSGPKKSSSTGAAATTTTDFSATQPADGETTTPATSTGAADSSDPGTQANQPSVPLSSSEDSFLKKLEQQGISLSVGTGSQVLASAHEYCLAQKNGTPSFTLPAVAGQLVEQQVTTMSVDAVVSLLESAAKETVCAG